MANKITVYRDRHSMSFRVVAGDHVKAPGAYDSYEFTSYPGINVEDAACKAYMHEEREDICAQIASFIPRVETAMQRRRLAAESSGLVPSLFISKEVKHHYVFGVPYKYLIVPADWMEACGFGNQARVFPVLMIERRINTFVTVDRDGYKWVVDLKGRSAELVDSISDTWCDIEADNASRGI